MSIYNTPEFLKLQALLPTIENNNKKQTIKRYHPDLWKWICDQISILYPNNIENERSYIYLLMNFQVNLICGCSTKKKYIGGKYKCYNPSCPTYNRHRQPMSTEKWISLAKEVWGDFFNYSKTIYVRPFDKIIIICPIHGEFLQCPNDHRNGAGCKQCKSVKQSLRQKGTHDKTTEEFIDSAQKVHGNILDYSCTLYKGVNHKVNIICPKHGEFLQLASNHLNGASCPSCKETRGEREIRKTLSDLKINFKPQHRLLECRNILPLPFDFAIIKNNEVTALIEFQGIQHYKPIKRFKKESLEKAENRFQQTIINDEIKIKFCIQNTLPLLVIPYWNIKDIPEIINKWLKENR